MPNRFLTKLFSFFFISARRLVYGLIYFFSFLNFKNRHSPAFVLCYHHLGRDSWYHSVSPRNFRRQLDYLLRNYQPLSPDRLLAIANARRPDFKKTFLITFDDGYQSLLTLRPIIKKYGLQPILFVLACPHKADRFELANQLPLLTKDQIFELLADGWQLGCHGAYHKNLISASHQELYAEIIGAKQLLEKEFKTPIQYYAYAKGNYNPQIQSLVRQAGYLMAFSMDDHLIESPFDCFAIPRIGLNRTLSLLEFKSLLLPLNVSIRRKLRRLLQPLYKLYKFDSL